jgi:hypothetical protein
VEWWLTLSAPNCIDCVTQYEGTLTSVCGVGYNSSNCWESMPIPGKYTPTVNKIAEHLSQKYLEWQRVVVDRLV